MEQDQKALIAAFAYFLSASAKNSFLKRRLGARLSPM